MPTFQATIPYADTVFADKYFAEEVGPGNKAWTNSANQEKKAPALKSATKLIDTLNFIGRKAEVEQLREFPRDDDTEIPFEVAEATCEVAAALLNGNTLDDITGSDGIASESVGDASTSYSEQGRRELLEKNGQLPSTKAYRLLRPWLPERRRIFVDRV